MNATLTQNGCQNEDTRAINRQVETYLPAVDIVEEPERLLLRADLPGVRAEDLDVDFERGRLTIRGRVTPRNAPDARRWLLCEYGVGDFLRSFELGDAIDASHIEAQLRDGVLTLVLPKSQEILPRKIAVRSE